MRILAAVALGIVLAASATQSALAARPATRGRDISRFSRVTHACLSTAPTGYAVAIVSNPDFGNARHATLTLFQRGPQGRQSYASGIPQHVWFSKLRIPYAPRVRAEHDLHDHCGLPAWALKATR
jgi:hypothetical protein